ncbi:MULTISPECIES: ABC1 kinase family protein [unclassified Corynebacterium]|uniref:ABC1 kinase family protein n=1 Tax=unclassified Corynebacterium TaxID=2624378 RepID=UPI00264968E8|nr:AarF/UbiB family protein [Corynebacterium sp.]MDN5718638.1 AarF/UbiB family protein [Corynebacterium sp.]MDN6323939.1 AarF/UbiB family protein [Corynebacterium sp.]
MPQTPDLRRRYRRITTFGLRLMVVMWWFELVLPRLGLRRFSQRNQEQRIVRAAARFSALATDLGGLMIKVGQFMSTRIDVLPTAVTDELAGLQDKVPAEDFAQIRALAESELGMPLSRAFAAFDSVPLAAASLGQAYKAQLTPQDATDVGFTDVVVKVQRPGIGEIVDVDLAALRRIAGWLSRIRFIAARADVPALVEEFAHTSAEEIDYLHEGAEAESFGAEFRNLAHPAQDAPTVVWERTARRVLTLQDVSAVKISDVRALRAAGVDPSEVADRLAESMFTQLFDTGHFHADPHPGNIFVTPRGGGDFSLTFIDFGMTGTVDEDLKTRLQDLVVAVGLQDGAGMVAAMKRLGVLLPTADTDELEVAVTELFARFGGMGVMDLQYVDPREFEDFAKRFRDVIRSLPFQLPENFLLIMRAVSMLSGLCSTLDPKFNIWESVEPFAARLVRERAGASAKDVARRAMTTGLATARVLGRLPRRLDDAITMIESGNLSVNTPQVERQLKRLERAAVRVVAAIVFVGLVVGGAVLRGADGAAGVVGTTMMLVSAVPLLYAVFGGRGG